MIPAWIADMDLPTAPAVTEALMRRVNGDLGYPSWLLSPNAGPLAEAFAERMTAKYGWHPDITHMRPFNDINQALQVLLDIGSEPGDGVAVHTPAYHPFLGTLRLMDRPLHPIQLEPGRRHVALRGARPVGLPGAAAGQPAQPARAVRSPARS